jgi:diguanylate cyclase (GGDEF)-like protein
VALLLAFLAAATWSRRREAPEASAFAALIAAMAVYAFGYAGELAQTTVAAATRWLNVEYLGTPWAGGLWVLAACRHNRLKMRAWPLFVIPTITFLTYYTNPWHLFFSAPLTMAQRGPFSVLVVERGPFSVLDNAYLMVCFLAGTWIYLSVFRHASALYRRQALVLLLSSFAPFVSYFIYYAGASPWGLDITPLTLAITCGLVYYGIFYCGVFDLAPLARTLIFNTMRDGVLILDTRDRLLDFNPAAEAIVPGLSRAGVGGDIRELMGENAELVAAVTGMESSAELTILTERGPESFEVRTWGLDGGQAWQGWKREGLGRAVIFADVTPQVRLREELRRRSETDALTGIANRRRFHQALEMECLRFERGHAPLSVLMIDLDNFKEINDRFGHPAGDAVLRVMAERMLAGLRKTDLLARYGGEEFAVLLPETQREGAEAIAERLREAAGKRPVTVDGAVIAATVSIGVASHCGEEAADSGILLKRADLALYRAKASGRDCVCTA